MQHTVVVSSLLSLGINHVQVAEFSQTATIPKIELSHESNLQKINGKSDSLVRNPSTFETDACHLPLLLLASIISKSPLVTDAEACINNGRVLNLDLS